MAESERVEDEIKSLGDMVSIRGSQFDEDPFTWKDAERLDEFVFRPMKTQIETHDRRISEHDRKFTAMEAIAQQTSAITSNKWVKRGVIAAMCAPLVLVIEFAYMIIHQAVGGR